MAPQVHFIAFGLLLLAGMNFPVSEDIVIIISASIAATVIPENRYCIFIGCFAGAYLSDLVAYSIGRFGLSRLSTTVFFKRFFKEDKILRIEEYFERYGVKTLFFGRFIPFGVRNILFMTSGIIKLNIVRFMLVDVLALSITSFTLFFLGYTLGNNYMKIFPYLKMYKYIIFAVFFAILLTVILKKRYSDKKE